MKPEVFKELPSWLLTVAAMVAVGLMIRREFGSPGVQSQSSAVVSEQTVGEWETLVAAGHKIGSESAPTTILVFSDFECPACRGFTLQTLLPLLSDRPDDVAAVYRHWPLPYHRFAMPAALAAECAGSQGSFKAFHDEVFNSQDSLGLLPFEVLAARANVQDLDAFNACIADPPDHLVRLVEADAAAAVSAGSTGTPTVIVNGIAFGAPPTRQRLEAMMDSVARGQKR